MRLSSQLSFLSTVFIIASRQSHNHFIYVYYTLNTHNINETFFGDMHIMVILLRTNGILYNTRVGIKNDFMILYYTIINR